MAKLSPQRASSTARIIASRPLSQPTAARRGVAPLASRTVSAWISTSTGRVPSSAGNTLVPLTGSPRWVRNSADGLGTSVRPAALHREHADLVGAAEAVLHRAEDAVLVAALALEAQHRVDHMLEHARAGDACRPW